MWLFFTSPPHLLRAAAQYRCVRDDKGGGYGMVGRWILFADR
jgi:hypothetical protein